MAGTAADCELSRVGCNHFAVATKADDAALRRLLRENPMPGSVSLSFEREPDYFRGANIAGADDQTIVAHSEDRLLCMGRCSRRECWVDGRATRVGYLAELRLDAAARGHFALLRNGYRFFHELQRDRPAELYFTSIAADNERARRLLERGARGMPAYSFLSELVTLLIAVPRRPCQTKLRLENATPDRVPQILRVLNDHARSHQLAVVWTAEILQDLEQHGLPLDRFLLAVDGGKLVGCGALWDQRSFRQTVIRSYGPLVSVARPLVNLASRVLRTPELPKPGSVLALAFLSPLAFVPEAGMMVAEFIEAAFPLAARLRMEFVTLALPTTDSRIPALRRRFITRSWRSRLYRVAWPELPPFEFAENEAAFLPDVAFL